MAHPRITTYASYTPRGGCYWQAASETACWIVESLITVNGNTIMIMCLTKLIWTDWNLYGKRLWNAVWLVATESIFATG